MDTRAVCIAAVMLLLVPAKFLGQTQVGSAPASKGAMRFLEVEHDFGKLKDEKPVTHAFHFTNGSAKATITVKDVHASCGCTTPALTKKVYAPGESGEITVTFNPVGRQGKERKVVSVETDDPEMPHLELAINLETIPRIAIEPMSMWMGEVRFDAIAKTPVTKPIAITSRVPGFAIKTATIADARFKLTHLKTEAVDVDGEPGSRDTYEVSIATDLPIGRVQTALGFETNDSVRPRINVGVLLDVVGDLRISQYPVYLRMNAPNEKVTHEITISHRAQKPFKLLGAAVEGSDKMPIAVDFEPAANVGAWTVRLTGTSPAAGTIISGTLKLKTDLEIEPEFIVPVNGNVTQTPAAH